MQEFKMDKVFSPQDVETRIYEKWESSGAFKPVIDPESCAGCGLCAAVCKCSAIVCG